MTCSAGMVLFWREVEEYGRPRADAKGSGCVAIADGDGEVVGAVREKERLPGLLAILLGKELTALGDGVVDGGKMEPSLGDSEPIGDQG